jgi:hypothetical protein
MNNTKMVYHNQKMMWEPHPRQLQVGSYLAKIDGKKLPNSVTEDVGGFSLCPSYSVRQLRRIDRLRQRKQRVIIETRKPNGNARKKNTIQVLNEEAMHL